ncbi:hypothetical protein HRR83_009047 [Exophiala dermatitidis]|nr:hypothetical protein HRR73_009212 [Exophiala dermatitidis]KAJ4508220.1 hypothetical protein HRR74_007619 [Exophiala dermatitidis]KAJ4533222.1 hypothetical protein HRR77_008754 [Exophiala dermatitidis]KAJ4540134.1 hypothetical protein HRR76_003550 [Exophiala dermatitidis]KAJ4556838.1 hypothetical protein HRR79_008831 [Exophiala dermatitidis]
MEEMRLLLVWIYGPGPASRGSLLNSPNSRGQNRPLPAAASNAGLQQQESHNQHKHWCYGALLVVYWRKGEGNLMARSVPLGSSYPPAGPLRHAADASCLNGGHRGPAKPVFITRLQI